MELQLVVKMVHEDISLTKQNVITTMQTQISLYCPRVTKYFNNILKIFTKLNNNTNTEITEFDSIMINEIK